MSTREDEVKGSLRMEPSYRWVRAQVGGEFVADCKRPLLVWSYPDPIPECPKIKGLLCFYDERVDLVVDGELQERPETYWSWRRPAYIQDLASPATLSITSQSRSDPSRSTLPAT
jgi:hypothetical protein